MTGKHLALILPQRQSPFVIGARETNEPGPGEILVRIRSTALNPSDAKAQKRGIYVTKFPAVLGSDGSGVVEKVGEGVTRFDPGDDVFFHGAYDDNDLSTFQQYAIAVVDFAAKIPDSLSYDQAAALPLGIATASIGLYGKANGLGLVPLWKHGGLGKYRGMPIMIFGGAGSVGNYVIQLARMSGFCPIITTASLKHTNYLKDLGATHVIDRYLPFPALKQAVERITNAPINVIYDTVSIRETQEAAWQLLGPQGRLVVTLPSVIDDRHRVIHTNGNPHTEENWETGRQLWLHLSKWLEKGEIVPNHVETVPGGLKGIGAALERFEGGQTDGVKLVARPPETESDLDLISSPPYHHQQVNGLRRTPSMRYIRLRMATRFLRSFVMARHIELDRRAEMEYGGWPFGK
ncbi:chaperonin 10-like protein [Pisolithus tinctorius]|uniref:Enoyl reductase (ER) domain-containing protein n=1 Tax=Pisolithus tinctorius Marx 270 TaxID=870435 RepID=A0A0C3NAI3_PISTI|nr:chaperonin 10-like protein [Pisolithus tinctorius]KIN98109.1 hypothetical protein M404DRAFT_1005624 [Pisolithus tinctorius Marx 270]